MERLLLIDTFNYIHRAFHALPKTFKDAEGEPVNAVYGFTSMLISTLDILKPTYAIAAFEPKDSETLKAQEFEFYKAQRKETDPDLIAQIPKIEEVIKAFGIQKVFVDGYEADDVIGCMARQAYSKGIETIIVSNDKDILQLLNDKIRIFIADNTKSGGSFFDEAAFVSKFGFPPIELIDYKALRGDPSDNIPGVKGIGDKTATNLIQKYHTLENIYEHLAEILPVSVKTKLENDKASAFDSKKLATINCDLNVSLDISACKLKEVNKLQVIELMKKYNFKSLMRRLGYEDTEKQAKEQTVSQHQIPLI